ncbi:MAG: hypothetical protein V3W04_09390 [Gammaproteobacteria bacterium]
MVTYEELNEQNDDITELSNVLSYLIKDRSMCDSDTCCSLFYNYMDKVNEHMTLVEKNLYGQLLRHPQQEMNNTAKNFMSGSQEIKHIMQQYKKKWCDKKQGDLKVGGEHEIFKTDTDEMFTMILDRVQNEVEHLYPLIRKVSNG